MLYWCISFHFNVPLLASNRAAAFLQLVKLSKALADAETTIKLNPQWEKVLLFYFSLKNSFSSQQTFTFRKQNILVFIISSFKRTFLMHLQGYFRKGCILEAMEQYDDVCLEVLSLFPLLLKAFWTRPHDFSFLLLIFILFITCCRL